MVKPFFDFQCNGTLVFKTFICPKSSAVLNPHRLEIHAEFCIIAPLTRLTATSARLSYKDTMLSASLVLL